MGLLQIVWMNFRRAAVESSLAQGVAEFSRGQKLGMNWRWEERGGWWICTASPHFVRGQRYVGCLAMPGSASYGLSGGEKNFVRSLWSALAPNLRSQAAPGARPLGGRHQNLFGVGEPSGALPELRQSEAGAAGLAFQQPFLHQALCVLRGPALSDFDDPGRRPRVAPGLEDRQGSRQAVHAGAASEEQGRQRRGRSASTRSRSAMATPTASWSAIWGGGDRSGSAVGTAPKRAWISSTSG